MFDQSWTDGQTLLLILIALYFMEGLVWVPCGTTLFVGTGLWGRCFSCAGRGFASEKGGIEILLPLPATYSFICQQWPISLSPSGILSYVAQATPDGRRPHQEEVFWNWNEITSIVAHERDLLVNEQFFVRVGSHKFAAKLRDALLSIQNAACAERIKVIDDVLQTAIDPAEVRGKRTHFFHTSRTMILPGVGMWLILLVVLPLLVCGPLYGSTMVIVTWIAVCALGFCWAGQIVSYTVARRRSLRLAPSAKLPNHLWLFCISPSSALWARDRFARDLFSEFHPLAIASAVCTKDEFRKLARQTLRDLHYPMPPVCSNPDLSAQFTEQWFRGRLLAAVERTVVKTDCSLTDVLAPPIPDSKDVRSYCPRCESQFTLVCGACHLCGGIHLAALGSFVEIPPTNS